MGKTTTQPDITVRGGQVTIPDPTISRIPARHQPNTPPAKLRRPKSTKPSTAIPDPIADPVVEPETEQPCPSLDSPNEMISETSPAASQ